MLRVPDSEEILAMGEKLGLDFTMPEAEIVRERIVVKLKEVDQFYEAHFPGEHEQRPRGTSYRPSVEEDPLNAFISKFRIEGAESGPLAGKTVALKDHISVAGVPLTLGSHFMDGYIADIDATVVTRLLDHGATVIGKLNMDDFASGGGLLGAGNFGRTLNPHGTGFVSGGSSSGAGAAVAGGYVDIAIGGDQGGSVRNPASYCGIVGLKPTFGLVPHTGAIGADPSLDYLGPMTRRVEETALTLQCIAGPDGSDPRQRSMPDIPDYSSLLDRSVEGLRIGILDEGFGYPRMDDDVSDAVLAAADVLRGAGALVTRISVPAHTDAYVPASIIMAEGTRYLFDSNLGGTSADTYYPISLITAFGRFKQSAGYELPLSSKLNATFAEYLHTRYHGRFYAKAQNVRGAIRRAYDSALAEVDLLICPTKPTTAPRYVEPTNYVEEMEYFLSRGEPGNAAFSRNTAPFNYTGHPAISVPCAAVNGMPVGMQIVGRHFEDDVVLRAAYAFQESSGFVIIPDTDDSVSTTTSLR
jgi:amidase